MISNILRKNSLFFKIMCAVVVGVICISIAISGVIINISRDIFEKSYIDSQQKIIERVYEKLYDFHRKSVETINSINSNRSVRLYFTEDNLSYNESFNNIYNMNTHIDSLFKENNYSYELLIAGLNGKTYLKDGLLYKEPIDLLEMEISKKSLKEKDTILYQYLNKGFTSTTQYEPVVIITKALTSDDGEPYGILYLIIKEKEFEKNYDYFSPDLNSVYILNKSNIVISSNNNVNLGTYIEEFEEDIENLVINNELSTIYKNNGNINFTQRLPDSNLALSGVIAINKAIKEIYDMKKIIFICFIITLITLIIIFLIVKQVTRPLYMLIEKMSTLRSNKFDENIQISEVSGISEIEELVTTYNLMINDINSYIKELVKIQKEKRKAEIYALQMQINPHYVFNTLSSIKLLIWQGDKDRSIEVLDSFILLLRNTISKTDEFITIKEEIDNLKHYVLINNTRYGDRIDVQYFIMPNCYDYLVPKLLLQPFIENSFFHGFPSREDGRIEILIREEKDNINVRIVDNGVGIESQKLEALKIVKKASSKGLSGIGIKNVNDRIKLIYGNDYGIEIKSELGKGTEIIILLPKQLKK
ncbi:HAMP domain-containing protein [Clostridium sartagoforme]|uniref:histidine kinase n=1 Tax=Clostridium sartagoforme TaxID=84031 RepID=A0A4S2DQD4_9CLOT|nr:sensor histidine kinase [Clostridium sartagoforme]TGY44082.1 HAMP domain-containing protein [Clostridium sartagoforme]